MNFSPKINIKKLQGAAASKSQVKMNVIIYFLNTKKGGGGVEKNHFPFKVKWKKYIETQIKLLSAFNQSKFFVLTYNYC